MRFLPLLFLVIYRLPLLFNSVDRGSLYTIHPKLQIFHDSSLSFSDVLTFEVNVLSMLNPLSVRAFSVRFIDLR